MTPPHYGERQVLDHGLVRLVDCMGSDLSIIRAARVSFNADWRAGKDEGSDLKLLRRLYSGGAKVLPHLPAHSTPFESVVFTWEVKAPIFIFRQWHRHRTWSYNEVSARYSELPEEFYLPDPMKIGLQSTASKQGRALDGVDIEQRRLEVENLRVACEDCFLQYRRLLAVGWPRELARSVLPVNTYSRMFATVNLLNLLKFLHLRLGSHAQYEIRVYAEAMCNIVADICPATIDLFLEARDYKP